MAMRQDVGKQIEGQIAVWQAQTKEHHERMALAGALAPWKWALRPSGPALTLLTLVLRWMAA